MLPALLCLAALLAPADEGPWDLFVASRNSHAVERFDGATGAHRGTFVTPRSGGLESTQCVVFAPGGDLLVTGRGTPAVLRFDGGTGALLGPFTNGRPLDEPTKCAFGPDGHLYVSQWGQQRSTVAVYDGTTGAFLRDATPDLDRPLGLAWDRAGVLHVASFGTRDVRRYDADGTLLRVVTGPGQLRSAADLWFASDGDLFVLDWEAGQLVRFDPRSGRRLDTPVYGLTRAEGAALSPDGRVLFVCDWEENTVEAFDADTGRYRGTFARGGGLLQPNSLAVGPRPAEAPAPASAEDGPGRAAEDGPSYAAEGDPAPVVDDPTPASPSEPTMDSAHVPLPQALAAHHDSDRSYTELLRVPDLNAGVYTLAAGASDPQQPHDADEVYYVLRGRATLIAGDQRHPVAPGGLLYVARDVVHRFVDIEEDLELLVLFATAAPASAADG